MTKEVVPLSENEKALFRKTFRTRMWLALFLGVPLLYGIVLITYAYVDYNIDVFVGRHYASDWDFGTYFFFFIMLLGNIFLWFYVIPFYIKTFKNRFKTHKIVVTTTIRNIVKSIRDRGIMTYDIQTEYMHIDTFYQVFLTATDITQLQEGMTIEIHHLENNFTDIINTKHKYKIVQFVKLDFFYYIWTIL